MIPKIIHRIWIEGSPPMAPAYIEAGQKWATMNPGWTVKHWSGPPFRMVNSCLYEKAAPPHDRFRFKADLLRLELLLKYGGVYIDADMEPLRPLDSLLDGADAIAGWSPDRWKGKRILSNAFIGAVPGHPWIARCVAKMRLSVQAFQGKFLALMTGPHHVTRCLEAKDRVTTLEPAVLYPRTAEELAAAFTFHAWANRKALTMGALR